MSEDDDKPKGKDKDKKNPAEPDRSTPDPIDENFTKWLLRLHRNKEKAQFLVVTQLTGRSGNVRGEIVRTLPLKLEEVKDEEWVQIANELIEDMQEEANVYRTTRRFVIDAKSNLKGGVFASRAIDVAPTRMYAESAGMVETDDGTVDPMGGDILRKRAETVLQDGRFYSEQFVAMCGGVLQAVTEQNRDLYQLVKELHGELRASRREQDQAESHALDREIIREKERLKIEMQRSGFNLAAKLLPGVVDTIAKHKDGKGEKSGGNGTSASGGGSAAAAEAPPQGEQQAAQDSGCTTESEAIERAMKALSPAEKTAIFGVWTSSGMRTQAGILTEAQVRIVVSVLNQEVPPTEIRRLIADKSPDKVTDEQLMRVLGSAAIDKLEPLLKIINDHKDAIAREAKLPQTN